MQRGPSAGLARGQPQQAGHTEPHASCSTPRHGGTGTWTPDLRAFESVGMWVLFFRDSQRLTGRVGTALVSQQREGLWGFRGGRGRDLQVRRRPSSPRAPCLHAT